MGILEMILSFVESLGYIGIFIMTFVEGTFVPIPNEVTMIPAGYLVAEGKMHMFGVLFAGIAGNLIGGWVTYYVAYHYGRILIEKYGKYVFFTTEKLRHVETFFAKHGPISILIGRIMPGLKHFISFPAGLARMNVKLFSYYTVLGGGLWLVMLVLLGYFIGNNKNEIIKYLAQLKLLIVVIISGLLLGYYFINRRKQIT